MLLGVSSMCCFNLVDVDTGIVTKKYDGNCYGFTFNEDYYFLKTSQHNIRERKILVFDKNFKIVMQITKNQQKIICGHQMQYHTPSNKLWLTSPGEHEYCNDIYIYDLATEEYEIWTPIRDKHRLHYNSLCFRGDFLHILSHNYHIVPSFVYTYEWKTRKLVDKKALIYGDCHNIFYIGDDLYYCASMQAKVLRVTGDLDVFVDPKQNGGNFSRGIALNDKYLFVGNSVLGKTNCSIPGKEMVLIYDIVTGKFIRSINIPGAGAIHEIRILDGVDYAHTTEGHGD